MARLKVYGGKGFVSAKPRRLIMATARREDFIGAADAGQSTQ